MKIAFDYSIFSLQKFGGISRYFVSLADSLKKKEIDVKIFAPRHINNYIKELDQTLYHGKKITKIPAKMGRFYDLFNIFSSRKLIKNFDADIIHNTYFPRFSSLMSNLPRVVTVHDMIHEKFKSNFGFWDSTSSLKLKAIREADHIICISNSTKNDLLDLYNIDEEKISVIHHGFEKSFLLSSKEKVSNQEAPYLLFVGSRNGYKNFISFIKDYASDKELMMNFNVVAFGGSKFNKSELNLFRELKIPANKIKHISGSDKELARLYVNASAFVYPSIYEGFGLPLLEAMAAECPVVAFHSSSIPEVAGNAAEYIYENVSGEISKAIKKVVLSDSRKNQLVIAGRKQLNNFSWAKCAEATISAYKKIL